MDFLTDELEKMAGNLAAYSGPEAASEIPLDHIGGSSALTSAPQEPLRQPYTTAKKPSKRRPNGEYLLKLSGPLHSPSLVREAAGLAVDPTPISGSADDDSPATFCRISEASKGKLEGFLHSAGVQRSAWPTFVRLSAAAKELDSHSAYPTLGLDPTMPQHRASGRQTLFYPREDEFPVWYFFYGTLADPGKLVGLLGLSDSADDRPVLRTASVAGGELRTWAGKYKALVDGPGCVRGWACRVLTREHEDCLRAYETERYEVVRCEVDVEGEGRVRGCTFRFVDEGELD